MASTGGGHEDQSLAKQQSKLGRLQHVAATRRRYISATLRALEGNEKDKKVLDAQLIQAIKAVEHAKKDVEDQKEFISVITERDNLLKEKKASNNVECLGEDGPSDDLYLKALENTEQKMAAKATEEESSNENPAVISPFKKRAASRKEDNQAKAKSDVGEGANSKSTDGSNVEEGAASNVEGE